MKRAKKKVKKQLMAQGASRSEAAHTINSALKRIARDGVQRENVPDLPEGS